MTIDLLKILAHSPRIQRWTPRWLKAILRRLIPVLSYDKQIWRQADPLRDAPEVSTYAGKYPFALGVIREFSHEHHHYLAACMELEVPYQLYDLSASDWVDQIKTSKCAAFLAWPSPVLTIWKEMYDERLKIMVDDLRKTICPSYHELWLFESKRRMRDWLRAHGVPHPKTEVFYDVDEALSFVERSELPLVLKTNHGAGAKGIQILHDRKQARRWIKRAFGKGIVTSRGDPRDRQWGSVLLQEYVHIEREWRMVRIGNSFFGHPKGRIGDFHSGSGEVLWDAPTPRLLDFLEYVTEVGHFTSMDVDVFETAEGELLVNELQAVFGAYYSKDQARLNGRAGRYVRDMSGEDWLFEPGDFAKNACCNLRVEYLIRKLKDDAHRAIAPQPERAFAITLA